jgi:hypothetical protein
MHEEISGAGKRLREIRCAERRAGRAVGVGALGHGELLGGDDHLVRGANDVPRRIVFQAGVPDGSVNV